LPNHIGKTKRDGQRIRRKEFFLSTASFGHARTSWKATAKRPREHADETDGRALQDEAGEGAGK
jgi:hypothetical protein